MKNLSAFGSFIFFVHSDRYEVAESSTKKPHQNDEFGFGLTGGGQDISGSAM